MNRRDFMIGNLAGAAVGAGAMYAASKFTARPLAAPAAPAAPAADKALPAPSRAEPLKPAEQTPADQMKPRDDRNADGTKVTYAQNGEDLILWQALNHVLRVDKPDYLDIGAWEPIVSNNTYLMYTYGCRGVLVEPNPTYVEKIRKARPEDACEGVGIGVTTEKEADYYLIAGDGQMNTFSKEKAEELKKENPNAVQGVIKMPLVNINEILAKHFKTAPALLSTDVEGMDLDILKSLDFDRWRPKVIMCEANAPGYRAFDDEMISFLDSKGYFLRGGNMVNALFLDRALAK